MDEKSILDITNLIIILVSMFLAFSFSNMTFRKIFEKNNLLPIKFFHHLVNLIIIIVGVYAILSQFEPARNASSILLRGGTLAIAILTFAAQQTLVNIIAGFSLSFTHPIQIGQRVRLNTSSGSIIVEGTVKDITIRHIVIEQFDKQTTIVPNSLVDSAVILNAYHDKLMAEIVEIEVGYEADIDKARELIYDAINHEPLIIKKDPVINVNRYTQNGFILRFTVWSKNYQDNVVAASHIRQKIVTAFRANNILIPFQTVTLNNPPKE